MFIPREPIRAETPRKIGVVGAGPGGILAAITASQRGHSVTLYEAHERLGGWLVAGSVPKTKYEVGNYLAYLEGQVERCGNEHGLTIKLNTTVTPESLRNEKFDRAGGLQRREASAPRSRRRGAGACGSGSQSVPTPRMGQRRPRCGR